MPHSEKQVSLLRRLKSHPIAILIITVAALGAFGY